MTVSPQNYMVRPGAEPQLVDVISELGIFGYVIGDAERIVTNKQVRHVTRDTWQLRRDTCVCRWARCCVPSSAPWTRAGWPRASGR